MTDPFVTCPNMSGTDIKRLKKMKAKQVQSQIAILTMGQYVKVKKDHGTLLGFVN